MTLRWGPSRQSHHLTAVALVLVVVLGQRLALPVGPSQLPLTPVFVAVVVAGGLLAGSLKLDWPLVSLLGVALAAVGVVTIFAYTRAEQPSVASIVLLVVIYLPSIAVVEDGEATQRALAVFVRLMVALSAVSLIFFILQFAGLPYNDHLREILPTGFIQQGYNTADALTYGSDIVRNNGLIFLEPSFFALFTSLALVVGLKEGRLNALSTLILASALLTSLSGTGIVLLLASLPFLALTKFNLRAVLRFSIPAGAVAGLIAWATPIFELLVQRSGETGTSGSSASLRLVEPYEIFLPAWWSDPASLLAGHGAGSAETYLFGDVLGGTAQVAVTSPVIAKLLYEFGILGAIPVMIFLLYLLARRQTWREWSVGLLLVYFVVNASLQQPTTAALCVVMLSVLSTRGSPADAASDASATHPSRTKSRTTSRTRQPSSSQ